MSKGMVKNGLKTNGSLWDLLAERFNTRKPDRCIHPDAVVNIQVGWPVFLSAIKKHSQVAGKKRLNILDFGCGAGGFCKALGKLGHNVIGLDQSKAMLDIAQSDPDSNSEFIYGNHKDAIFDRLEVKEKFDVVTAVHSLEWIEDVDTALMNLSKLLVTGGMLIFAVFPKQHVVDSLKINDLFKDFDSNTNPSFGYADFDGVRVPVWIRTSKEYDSIMKDLGFTKILEEEPAYPADFTEKYKWTGSKYPEMLILGYKKNTT